MDIYGPHNKTFYLDMIQVQLISLEARFKKAKSEFLDEEEILCKSQIKALEKEYKRVKRSMLR